VRDEARDFNAHDGVHASPILPTCFAFLDEAEHGVGARNEAARRGRIVAEHVARRRRSCAPRAGIGRHRGAVQHPVHHLGA
jgi:hypothetical protein